MKENCFVLFLFHIWKFQTRNFFFAFESAFTVVDYDTFFLFFFLIVQVFINDQVRGEDHEFTTNDTKAAISK
jgi:hypothetical protein